MIKLIKNTVFCLTLCAGPDLSFAQQATGTPNLPTVAVGGGGVCYELYLPVCAREKDGKLMSYSNECFARAAEAVVVSQGICGVSGK